MSKRKKLTKRSSRQKQTQATVADDLPSASSKKASASLYSRSRSATFTSATNPPTASSKVSFFSSFAPRWGRSQSYTNAAASVGSKVCPSDVLLLCWIHTLDFVYGFRK